MAGRDVGIYNVSPGAVTVIGTPAGLGKPASQATVFVKPGFVTVVQLVPSL